MRNIKLNFLLLLLTVLTLSCSKEDNNDVCLETNVSMVINGELQTFQTTGRGIDLNQDGGYTLRIWLSRGSSNPSLEQSILIVLPYQKRGDNVLDNFMYNQYSIGTTFNGDFSNGTIESKVITNSNTCFYATFSGTFNDGNQEFVITDGKLSYQYETPF
ncbi:hypothetical protein WMW71_07125 [Flavobacterium buctense]|uniref:Lipoprotein n=1 Tax=Flavobacterium buctense TaxID=1648146 RepID=A0ABU9E2F0_9FLAO|nr:hypothetical protein [Flavobacterium buctense]